MNTNREPNYHDVLLDIDCFLEREARQLYQYFLDAKKYLSEDNGGSNDDKITCIYCASGTIIYNLFREEIGKMIRERGISWFSEEFIKGQCTEIDYGELLEIIGR